MKLIDKSRKKSKILSLFSRQALIQEAKEENEPWNVYHLSAILGSLSNDDQNDFTKTIGFHVQNISYARASRFLVHFFDVPCTTTT